jgi:hypothetical protein
MTTDEILDDAHWYAEENNKSVQRMNDRLDAAQRVASDTVAELERQDRVMQRTQDALDDMEDMGRQNDRSLRVVDNLFGVVENYVESAVDKVNPLSTNVHVDTSKLANQRISKQVKAKGRGTGAAPRAAEASGSLTRAEMEVLREEAAHQRNVDAGLDRISTKVENLGRASEEVSRLIQVTQIRQGYISASMDRTGTKTRDQADWAAALARR